MSVEDVGVYECAGQNFHETGKYFKKATIHLAKCGDGKRKGKSFFR